MLLDPAFPQMVRDFCARHDISPGYFSYRVTRNTYTLDRMDRAFQSLDAKMRAFAALMDEVEPPPEVALVGPPPVYPEIALVVSSPQSTNKLHAESIHGGRRLTAKYAAWRKTAGQEIIAQRPTWAVRRLPRGPYTLDVLVPRNDPADVDNRLKSLIDLLAKMQITPDDKLLDALSIKRSDGVAAGKCAVSIRSLVAA